MKENIDESNRERLASEFLQRWKRYDKELVEEAANAVYNSIFAIPDAGFSYGNYASERAKKQIEEKGSDVSLSQDLGLDSLDLTELAIELEERGFVIDDKMLQGWRAPRGPKLMDLLEMAYESKEYERRNSEK
ncbi:phosphopantetheine-binding protein [Nanoarchaeota archaeon]